MFFHGAGKGRRLLGALNSWRVATAYRLSHNNTFFCRFMSTRENWKPLPFGAEYPYTEQSINIDVAASNISAFVSVGTEDVTGLANVTASNIPALISTGAATVSVPANIAASNIPLIADTGTGTVIGLANITASNTPLLATAGIATVTAIGTKSITTTGGTVIRRRLPPYPHWYPQQLPQPIPQPQPVNMTVYVQPADFLYMTAHKCKVAATKNMQTKTRRNKRASAVVNNVIVISSRDDSKRYWQHRRRIEEEEMMQFLIAA